MADCEQPTRAPTKLRFRQVQRFILSRLTVGAQIRHGNPPFLRLTAEFERSEKPATSSVTEGPLPTEVLAAIDDAALKAQPKWPPYFYCI
jgi:hypothetical protein